MCFCGEGTKYPNRPAAETCGFQLRRVQLESKEEYFVHIICSNFQILLVMTQHFLSAYLLNLVPRDKLIGQNLTWTYTRQTKAN